MVNSISPVKPICIKDLTNILPEKEIRKLTSIDRVFGDKNGEINGDIEFVQAAKVIIPDTDLLRIKSEHINNSPESIAYLALQAHILGYIQTSGENTGQ